MYNGCKITEDQLKKKSTVRLLLMYYFSLHLFKISVVQI